MALAIHRYHIRAAFSVQPFFCGGWESLYHPYRHVLHDVLTALHSRPSAVSRCGPAAAYSLHGSLSVRQVPQRSTPTLHYHASPALGGAMRCRNWRVTRRAGNKRCALPKTETSDGRLFFP